MFELRCLFSAKIQHLNDSFQWNNHAPKGYAAFIFFIEHRTCSRYIDQCQKQHNLKPDPGFNLYYEQFLLRYFKTSLQVFEFMNTYFAFWGFAASWGGSSSSGKYWVVEVAECVLVAQFVVNVWHAFPSSSCS